MKYTILVLALLVFSCSKKEDPATDNNPKPAGVLKISITQKGLVGYSSLWGGISDYTDSPKTVILKQWGYKQSLPWDTSISVNHGQVIHLGNLRAFDANNNFIDTLFMQAVLPNGSQISGYSYKYASESHTNINASIHIP